MRYRTKGPKYFGYEQSDQRLRHGLVAHWAASGQGSGGTLIDASGYGNHGALTGSTWALNRLGGPALSFDGVDDVVNCGSGASIDDVRPITIAAWIFPRTAGEGSLGYIFSKFASGGSGPRVLLDSINVTNGINFGAHSTGTANQPSRISNSNWIVLKTWQHVAITWDGSLTATNIHSYVNGVEVTYFSSTNGTTAITSDAADSIVLGNRVAADRTFDGYIADVRIYNRILSLAEIALLSRPDFLSILPMKRRVVSSGISYPRLERQIRGVNRGVVLGGYVG